ncbi:MAG: DUF4361 domain-containing protein [Prevotellaceae bacterium]|nr:DUF4361 domain-containing protein [Prevotellaceae bacterium]
MLLLAFAVSVTVSCDEDAAYKKEMYKKVLYLLSDNNQVYTEIYTLNEDEPVKYLSIGCGGSLPNEEDVTITLEPDTILLNKYNRSNYDIDSASFAKVLPETRYKIPSMSVTLPANSEDQYVRVPISVRPEGLSPDSIYFIPLSIKSSSKYEINPDKRNVLYRIVIENDYATQKTVTYYHMKGVQTAYGSDREVAIAGTQPMYPLTGNKVRIFAGSNLQTNSSKPADIDKYSVVLHVNDDNSIDILPYGSIDVIKIQRDGYNIYSVEGKEKYFYIYYRYRTLTTPATATSPAVWSSWNVVRETLRRLE